MDTLFKMIGATNMTRCIIALFCGIIFFPLSSGNASKLDPKLEEAYKSFKKGSICTPIITSGYRTAKKNKDVGGAKNSYHLKGKALDIKFKNCKNTLEEISQVAKRYFNGVILYKYHIHVDVRKNKYYGAGNVGEINEH